MKFIQAACCAALATIAAGEGKATYVPEAKLPHSRPTKVAVAPVPFCPDGTEYGPAGCARFETAEPKISCPHPYKMSDKGVCVTRTHGESAHVCPKGSYLDGHKCVTEVTEEVITYCKHGELTKDGCLVRGEPKVVKPSYKKVDYVCPKGFKLHKDTCVAEHKEDAILSCEKGFELVGKKCVTSETAPYECKRGTLSKDGCIDTSVASPEPVCPHGSKFDGKGNCVSKVVKKPTQVCEKGYELSKKGKCVTEVLVQAMPTKKGEAVPFKCHGRSDEKGNCFQSHTIDSAYVCDKGFELSGHKCVSLVSVTPDLECPKGYETSSVGKKADCVKTKIHKASCPKGFKESKGVCTKTISTKPAKICPNGSDDKHCTVLETVAPTPVCPPEYEMTKDGCMIAGYTVPGEDKVHPVKLDCPKGFKLDKKDMTCVNHESSKPAVVCEKGYELDGKKCVAVHSIAPVAMCPKGFVGGKDGKTCTRTTYDHPRFTCPKGTEGKGKKCYTIENVEPYTASIPSKKY